MKNIFLAFLFVSGILWSQNDGYATSPDGTKTYYRTFGSGKSLLIINGGPGMNSNGFETLARKLSESNQTIIYDQRGTGKSGLAVLDEKTITMDLMVSDIEALRKELRIEKWIVLGHSFGGMLASYYATKHPGNIEKMILSASGGIDLELLNYVPQNTNLKLTKTEQDSLAYWNGKIAKGDTSYKTRLGRGRALAPAYVYDRKFIPVLAERLTQGNSTINNLIWDNLRKIPFDCKSGLLNFKQPVLIIQGKQDIIKPRTAELAHQALQNSKVVLLDHCGHYGWLDAEKEYFAAIDSFLKR